MEVKQYMTPEGLEHYLLVNGVLVCLEEIEATMNCPAIESRLPLSMKQVGDSQTEDLLRSNTHQIVRVRYANYGKRK
jgi:hypothetical protein